MLKSRPLEGGRERREGPQASENPFLLFWLIVETQKRGINFSQGLTTTINRQQLSPFFFLFACLYNWCQYRVWDDSFVKMHRIIRSWSKYNMVNENKYAL